MFVIWAILRTSFYSQNKMKLSNKQKGHLFLIPIYGWVGLIASLSVEAAVVVGFLVALVMAAIGINFLIND